VVADAFWEGGWRIVCKACYNPHTPYNLYIT
jgi:hypothetical protein